MKSRDNGFGLSHRLRVCHLHLEVDTLPRSLVPHLSFSAVISTRDKKMDSSISVILTFWMLILQDGSSLRFREHHHQLDMVTQQFLQDLELLYLVEKETKNKYLEIYMHLIL